MKRFIFGALGLVIGPTIASAADMALKAPPPPAPAFSWTGFYVGGNVGYGWGAGGTTNGAIAATCLGVVTVACAQVVTNENTFLNKFNSNPKGVLGGAQVGYNYQLDRIVWGIEADFQGANMNGTGSAAGTSGIPGFPVQTVPVTGTGSEKIDWFGTVRGRFGWTVTPPFLVYTTGGLAYGHVRTSASFSGAVLSDPAGLFTGTTAIAQSNTLTGYTLGGGLEWMFAPRWSAKAEYLYYDLGSVNLGQNLSVASVFNPATQLNSTIRSAANYHGSIARAGINYHF